MNSEMLTRTVMPLMDQFDQICRSGPIDDGDLVSKDDRTRLVEMGWVKRGDGKQWPTETGLAIWHMIFDGCESRMPPKLRTPKAFDVWSLDGIAKVVLGVTETYNGQCGITEVKVLGENSGLTEWDLRTFFGLTNIRFLFNIKDLAKQGPIAVGFTEDELIGMDYMYTYHEKANEITGVSEAMGKIRDIIDERMPRHV
jgi:hypothetical protein